MKKNISLFDNHCSCHEFKCPSGRYDTMTAGDRFYLSDKW